MKTVSRLTSLLLVFVLACAPALAQQAQPAATGPQSLSALQQRIAALLDQPQFAAARWGVLIKPANGNVIFARDADKAFMPASNMKLYTSAAALDSFGPDFKLKTSIYATEPVSKSGTLRGDLIFYGRGDPNISPRFDADNTDKYDELNPKDTITPIEQLADQIKARGVRVIAGNLIGDDSYFAGDLLGPGWEWDDAQFYYGAEVSALTVNDNAVTFIVTPGRRAGDKPTIKVQPATDYLQINNQATTSDAGATRIGVHRQLNNNAVEFFGTIPRGAAEFKVNIAIHDPARFAATLLKEALQRRGIRVHGRVERMDARARVAQPFDETKLIELAAVSSQPLTELLKVVNKPSQNLHTELLLRQLSKLYRPSAITQMDGGGEIATAQVAALDSYGRPQPSNTLGNEVRKQFLQRIGVDIQPLSLRDGSGLARQDLVTPRATVRLLDFMRTHQHADHFRASLPIAGVDGTLERRLRNTAAANNVRAKTGTLSYVNALSGYVTTKRGQLLIFSLMGNNYVGAGRDVTGVFDQICVLLAEFAEEL
jgi:serine-type D-Ala-D-Ala carboxypeptidase/endopeptidase (penicillin-binding protein 4)